MALSAVSSAPQYPTEMDCDSFVVRFILLSVGMDFGEFLEKFVCLQWSQLTTESMPPILCPP